MNDMSQETRDLYARTLSTMTYGLDVLRDEPDPDGALADLAQRIEAEREWVRSLMASVRSRAAHPTGWGVPARAADQAALDEGAKPPKM